MNENNLLGTAARSLGVIDGYKLKPYPTQTEWNAQYIAIQNLNAYGPDLARLAVSLAEENRCLKAKLAELDGQK